MIDPFMKRHFPPDKPIIYPVPSQDSNRSHNPQPEVAEIAFADARESRGHFRERLSAVFHWLPAAVGVGSGDAHGGLGVYATGVATFVIYERRCSPLRALKHRSAFSLSDAREQSTVSRTYTRSRK